MINKVIIMGNVASDIELKTTKDGVSVISFTLAHNDKVKKAHFFSVVAWRQTAEFIAKFFTKGKPMLICGELQTREWEAPDGKRKTVEILAQEIHFIEGRKEDKEDKETEESGLPF